MSSAESMMRAAYYRCLQRWLNMLEEGTVTYTEVNEWWRAMDREYEEKGLLV